MTSIQDNEINGGAVTVMRRRHMPSGGVGHAPAAKVRETVAYEIHPGPNSFVTNSSIPPSMIQTSSSVQPWLTASTSSPNDAALSHKALPNIEPGARRAIGPRLLGSYPGLIHQGSSGTRREGKRHRITRHATFSDSFLHSRMEPLNGRPLGSISKDKSSNPGDVRKAVSAGTTFSNATAASSPRRIRFHSVDGSHFISKHSKLVKPGLQNIMRPTFVEETKSDSSSILGDDKNKTKETEKILDSLIKETDKTIDDLQERAKRLKRIVEQDKLNNNEPLYKNIDTATKHRNYCDQRKTSQVVKWLREINKQMYDSLT